MHCETKVSFDSTAAALPPDVKYRLEIQEPVLKLDSSTPASPPDVRRGSASPSILDNFRWALPLVRALP